MNNPEKLEIQGVQDKEKQSKNTTHVLNTTINKQTIRHERTEHRFYMVIVTHITTWNSERKHT